MKSFTESTIEQAAIEWQEETLKVSFVSPRYPWRVSLANRDEGQQEKPLGSARLASLRDSLLPKLMRGEVRVK